MPSSSSSSGPVLTAGEWELQFPKEVLRGSAAALLSSAAAAAADHHQHHDQCHHDQSDDEDDGESAIIDLVNLTQRT